MGKVTVLRNLRGAKEKDRAKAVLRLTRITHGSLRKDPDYQVVFDLIGSCPLLRKDFHIFPRGSAPVHTIMLFLCM